MPVPGYAPISTKSVSSKPGSRQNNSRLGHRRNITQVISQIPSDRISGGSDTIRSSM